MYYEVHRIFFSVGVSSIQSRFIQGQAIYGDRFDVYGQIINNRALNVSEMLQQLEQLSLIQSNFLRLNVNFNLRGYSLSTDTAAMTWDSVMSNVGGTMSLWVGVTAMTIVEVLELFYNLCLVRARSDKVASGVDQ